MIDLHCDVTDVSQMSRIKESEAISMRISRTLQKLRAGQVARICALGAQIHYFPSVAARYKYDGVFLDGEHRRWGTQSLENSVLMHHLADVDCIVRPPSLERFFLSRLLEDGVTGLIIPHVSTPEIAHRLVQAVKFPPDGERGFDGAGLDADFLGASAKDYVDHAALETFLVVQIETPQALANVDDIASIPGVDVLLIGPGDLSLRLGCSANVDDPTLAKAEDAVAQAAAKYGKSWGRPVGDALGVKLLIEMGAKFIVFGGDFGAVDAHLAEKAAQLDEILGDTSTVVDLPGQPRNETSAVIY